MSFDWLGLLGFRWLDWVLFSFVCWYSDEGLDRHMGQVETKKLDNCIYDYKEKDRLVTSIYLYDNYFGLNSFICSLVEAINLLVWGIGWNLIVWFSIKKLWEVDSYLVVFSCEVWFLSDAFLRKYKKSFRVFLKKKRLLSPRFVRPSGQKAVDILRCLIEAFKRCPIFF